MILCKTCTLIQRRNQRFTKRGGFINENLDINSITTGLKPQQYERGYPSEYEWGKCSICEGPLTKEDLIKSKLHEQRKGRSKNEFRINVTKIERGEINIMGGMDPLMRKYKGTPITGIGVMEYESGKLKTEIQYEDGYQIRLKHFYENGLIKSDSNVKGGQLHGKEKTWYENGELESECNYENDQVEGLFTKYYRTGEVEYIGHLKNNKQVGIWKYYSKNGELIKEEKY